ncbi:MAG: hypothetical protein HY737_03550 [Candidatus Omnitrophica bacterium]|nr:hypothetical protein [Candidatus Omnitrophota bacterium]
MSQSSQRRAITLLMAGVAVTAAAGWMTSRMRQNEDRRPLVIERSAAVPGNQPEAKELDLAVMTENAAKTEIASPWWADASL